MAQSRLLSVLSAVRHGRSALALTVLSCALGAVVASANPPAVYPLKRSAAEERILKALDESTTIDFVEQPLSDVIRFLERLHKIQIEIDGKSLEDGAASADTPITRNLSNISLANALTLILGDLDCDYLIRNDVLMILTVEAAEEATELRLYNIKDLITADRTSASIAEMIARMFAVRCGNSLELSPVGEVLVIRDTQRGHGEIEVLLDTLRRALAGEPLPAAQALAAPAANPAQVLKDISTAKSSAVESGTAGETALFDEPPAP